MFSPEKRKRVRQWWDRVGSEFLELQWRRLALGCVVGSMLAAGAHLLIRDSRFAPLLTQAWAKVANQNRFDGFRAYRAELEALFIGVFAISAIHVLSWLRRYVRAWWAGITSLTFLFA